MLRFMHLPTVTFMPFSLCAARKIMIPNAHKLPRILSALLVSVYFLFNYIFLKHLFVKNT